LVDRIRFWQNEQASQHVRKEPTKNELLIDFCFELIAQRLFSSDLPPSPKTLVYTRKELPIPTPKIPVPKKTLLSILLVLIPSSKSLVDKGKFWQNGPASQHVRKEPTKNKFLVNFYVESTAQRLFSSDLPPSPISLVVRTKKVFPLP
jgi:hypothetical protein